LLPCAASERFKINCKNLTEKKKCLEGKKKMTADVISDLFEAFFVTVMISFYPLKKTIMLKGKRKKIPF